MRHAHQRFEEEAKVQTRHAMTLESDRGEDKHEHAGLQQNQKPGKGKARAGRATGKGNPRTFVNHGRNHRHNTREENGTDLLHARGCCAWRAAHRPPAPLHDDRELHVNHGDGDELVRRLAVLHEADEVGLAHLAVVGGVPDPAVELKEGNHLVLELRQQLTSDRLSQRGRYCVWEPGEPGGKEGKTGR